MFIMGCVRQCSENLTTTSATIPRERVLEAMYVLKLQSISSRTCLAIRLATKLAFFLLSLHLNS